MELKLPFGLKSGQIVHVSDPSVVSGLECGCVCPACKQPLEAKKGAIRAHHFAHHNQSQCEHAFETAIHMAAKRAIEDSGYIMLPKVEHSIVRQRQSYFGETKIHFDKIFMEKKLHDIIPDIVIEKNGRQLCIEIYVTHEVDRQKYEKIVVNKLSTIEINLSQIDRLIDFELLKTLVVDSTENKRWLFNLRRYELHQMILKNSIKRDAIPHGLVGAHVDNCPKPNPPRWNGRPCANLRDDCFYCEYFVTPIQNYRDDYEHHYNHEEGVVYCIGHKSEKEISALLSRSSEVTRGKVVA